MEKYTYSAKDTSGKNVTGTLEAESEAGVIKNLRAKGLTVLNVSTTAAKSGRRFRRRKVKLEDVVVFS
ncbi:type II secretion system F family protein, partial [PVC group bacterium]|nr:type II secretion system F family protein [PVC group bacterium]